MKTAGESIFPAPLTMRTYTYGCRIKSGEENMTGTEILRKFSKSCDGHEDDDDAADNNPFEKLKKFGKGDMPDDVFEILKVLHHETPLRKKIVLSQMPT